MFRKGMKILLVGIIFTLALFAWNVLDNSRKIFPRVTGDGLFSEVEAAEIKIGYVDLGKALNDSKRGKDAKAELEALVKQKQSQIDELEKKINTQRAEFEKQAPALSEKARQEKQAEIERSIQDYQKLVQDAQAEVEKKRRDLTTGILKELRDIINEIGKKEGYTIILESSEGLILYSKEGLDLTDRIIKIYDERQKK
ncbi:MAG: OmpH family outer membrane protein [Thermodesulfovibrionales bacterium]|nr:OmpH family outer membrane protein [Thermodesulfovibrionales bacterium]